MLLWEYLLGSHVQLWWLSPFTFTFTFTCTFTCTCTCTCIRLSHITEFE
jgi:hypothetical protein